MKILNQDERNAHIAWITAEGAKGLFYGLILSLGLYGYLKSRHTVRFNQFNTSIKTCIITMPTISMGAFFADQGSWEFDKKMHSSLHQERRMMEEYKAWEGLTRWEKTITTLNSNKYKIVFGAWLGTMWGLWALVNRNKIMTQPQKLVQARMYAQAITVVLLLGTMVLAMQESEIKKKQGEPVPEWRRVLMEREE